jgi:hypothetical protein
MGSQPDPRSLQSPKPKSQDCGTGGRHGDWRRMPRIRCLFALILPRQAMRPDNRPGFTDEPGRATCPRTRLRRLQSPLPRPTRRAGSALAERGRTKQTDGRRTRPPPWRRHKSLDDCDCRLQAAAAKWTTGGRHGQKGRRAEGFVLWPVAVRGSEKQAALPVDALHFLW